VVDKLDYCANLNNLKAVAGLMNFKFVKGDIGSVRYIAPAPSPRPPPPALPWNEPSERSPTLRLGSSNTSRASATNPTAFLSSAHHMK